MLNLSTSPLQIGKSRWVGPVVRVERPLCWATSLSTWPMQSRFKALKIRHLKALTSIRRRVQQTRHPFSSVALTHTIWSPSLSLNDNGGRGRETRGCITITDQAKSVCSVLSHVGRLLLADTCTSAPHTQTP